MATAAAAGIISPSVSVSFSKEKNPSPPASLVFSSTISRNRGMHRRIIPFRIRCSEVPVSETELDYEAEDCRSSDGEEPQSPPRPLLLRRRRYRRQCPGETKGISEEMRFVAMKLRNNGNKPRPTEEEDTGKLWEASMEGFLKYLVDSRLVFSTIERIVDESSDVSLVYFRNTGLERCASISMDLERLSQKGNDIPAASSPGTTYAQYLEGIAGKNPPLFLCHFYNIYFSHIAGGQAIVKQVSKQLLEGNEMDSFKWEGDAEELLREVRLKLNAIAEHWSREEKNKCLREATKAYRFLGQIVRLIVS